MDSLRVFWTRKSSACEETEEGEWGEGNKKRGMGIIVLPHLDRYRKTPITSRMHARTGLKYELVDHYLPDVLLGFFD